MLRSKWTFWGVLAVGVGGAFILAGFTALPTAGAICSAVGAAVANYIFSVSNIPRSCRLRVEADMTAAAERYFNDTTHPHHASMSSSAHILTVVRDDKAEAANDARSTVTASAAAAASVAVTVSPTIMTNLITTPSQPSEIALTMRPSRN
jgi:hypothetical protein